MKKKLIIFLYFLLSFFVVIFNFIWFFLPKNIKNIIIINIYRLSYQFLLKKSLLYRETVYTCIFLSLLIVFLFIISFYIIKIKTLIFFFLLLFFFLHIVGGFFVLFFFYVCIYTDFFKNSKILKKYLDWYNFWFGNYSGKFFFYMYFLFFWYIKILHTPISFILKTKISYERHFLYSIFSAIFIFFFILLYTFFY